MLIALLLQTSPATTNPIVTYLTLLAAVIAAGASFYSTITASATAKKAAELAAETALEIKNREYRNDYYKRVVDKRMLAIERIDALNALFRPIRRVMDSDTEIYHALFFKKSYEEDYENNANQILALSFWIDTHTYNAVREFNKEIRGVIREYKAIQDPQVKKRFAIDKYDSIESKRREVAKRLIIDLKTLDDINSFISIKEQSIDKFRS